MRQFPYRVLCILCVFLGSVIIFLWFPRVTHASWSADFDPPTTAISSIAGCVKSGGGSPGTLTTITCPDTITPSFSFSCTDALNPPCKSVYTYASYFPSGGVVSCPSTIPVDLLYTPYAYTSFTPPSLNASFLYCVFGSDQLSNTQPQADPYLIQFTYSITGNIFKDFDNNGAKDTPADTNLSGITVDISGGFPSQTTDANGNFTFANLPVGSYTITLHIPANYKASTYITSCFPTTCVGPGTTSTPAIGVPPSATVSFGLTPLYSVSGYVYLDVPNGNGLKDPGENYYTGSINMSVDGNTSQLFTNTGSGTQYILSNLLQGSHTITYSPLPSQDYHYTYPSLGTYAVAVGLNCVPPNDAKGTPIPYTTCTGGSIQELDFGISNLTPWFQCNGMDCRMDSGFTDQVPTGYFASNALPVGINNNPGVLFTGTHIPSGAISATGWLVGGIPYGETFAPAHRTSYRYLSTKIQDTEATNLSTKCSIFSCDLSSLPSGLYTVTSDLTTITATMTIPANTNIVILVPGNLTIKGNIIVPIGSTLIISTGGALTIDTNVTEIDGFYSTDMGFDAGGSGINACLSNSPDQPLSIQGALVTLGTFTYKNRELCTNDATIPSLTINARPDFIINAPQIILYQSQIWQEIAP